MLGIHSLSSLHRSRHERHELREGFGWFTAETLRARRGEFKKPLYYNSRNCSQAAMKFSCCQADEFVRICLPGRQERCDNSVALFGYLPAIGVGNFGDQSMSVQQSQSPRDLG